MAISNAQAYGIYRNSMGGSDPVKTNANKRATLPTWNSLAPQVQAGWAACLVGPPASGQAAYTLYGNSVNAAEPFPKTILGIDNAVLPAWSGLLPIQQAAWNAVRAAMVTW